MSRRDEPKVRVRVTITIKGPLIGRVGTPVVQVPPRPRDEKGVRRDG